MKLFYAFLIAKRILFQKKGGAFFSVFTLTIAAGALFLFLSFSQGVQGIVVPFFVERSSPTSLIVSPSQKPTLFEKRVNITDSEVKKIQDTEYVTQVRRRFVFRFPSSIRISFFGFSFDTDAPFYGFDISEETKEDGRVPVFLSPFLVDIFNSSIIESTPGVPKISTKDVIGMEMDLFFGRSTFFSTDIPFLKVLEKKAYIAGFSPEIPLIGATIPFQTATEINKKVTGMNPSDITYQNLFLEVDKVQNIPIIKALVQKMGLSIRSHKDLVEEIQNILSLTNIVLIFSGVLISLVAFITLASLLSLLLLEQQKNIGVFRVLGAQKRDVFSVFFVICFLLSGTGCFCGIVVGYTLSTFLNKWLFSVFSDLSFFSGDLFLFSLPHTSLLFFCIIMASFLVSSVPIIRGLKKQPLDCLLQSR
jgi:ABC-type lipoprotein release transport system permease subunit